jgi:hypothetical protein
MSRGLRHRLKAGFEGNGKGCGFARVLEEVNWILGWDLGFAWISDEGGFTALDLGRVLGETQSG